MVLAHFGEESSLIWGCCAGLYCPSLQLWIQIWIYKQVLDLRSALEINKTNLFCEQWNWGLQIFYAFLCQDGLKATTSGYYSPCAFSRAFHIPAQCCCIHLSHQVKALTPAGGTDPKWPSISWICAVALPSAETLNMYPPPPSSPSFHQNCRNFLHWPSGLRCVFASVCSLFSLK